MKTVYATSNSGVTSYAYLCAEDTEVQPGDAVVVESTNHSGYAVHRVTRVADYQDINARLTVLFVIDESAKRLAAQREAERRRLQHELDSKLEVFRREQALTLLLQQDPEAALLAKKLEALNG